MYKVQKFIAEMAFKLILRHMPALRAELEFWKGKSIDQTLAGLLKAIRTRL